MPRRKVFKADFEALIARETLSIHDKPALESARIGIIGRGKRLRVHADSARSGFVKLAEGGWVLREHCIEEERRLK